MTVSSFNTVACVFYGSSFVSTGTKSLTSSLSTSTKDPLKPKASLTMNIEPEYASYYYVGLCIILSFMCYLELVCCMESMCSDSNEEEESSLLIVPLQSDTEEEAQEHEAKSELLAYD